MENSLSGVVDMSENITEVVNSWFDQPLTESFIRDFSIDDIKLFQSKYKGLTTALQSWQLSGGVIDLILDLSKQDPKNEIILTMCLAKYAPEEEPLKKISVERLKFFIENTESDIGIPVDSRKNLVDGIAGFFPPVNPVYKELHDHIRAWNVARTSWMHAREEAKHEI